MKLQNFQRYKNSMKLYNRALEGSSPILGFELASSIKKSELHPEQIYNEILNSNEQIDSLIYKSATAYFQTLHPGIDDYCSTEIITTGERSQWTVAENNHSAAIPQEVIGPITNEYIKNLDDAIKMNSEGAKGSAKNLALRFQIKRKNCPNIKKYEDLENKLERYCINLGFCLDSSKVNSIISSAEAAYPRKQFSINGFTRYVYKELLESENLISHLKTIYDLERRWILNKNLDLTDEKFFDYVVSESVHKNVHIKDVMLILAYSMRNMPSLDIEYAINPQKALLLEVYFWRFRDLRNQLTKPEYFEHVFPGKKFQTNPGFYHYLTAALLGCEARLADLGHFNAISLGIASKFAYKMDKFMKSLEYGEMAQKTIREKRMYIKEKMKQQGTWAGIIAGKRAAQFGSKACQEFKKELRNQFRENKRAIRQNYSNEEKKERIKKLKADLQENYQSILDEYKEEGIE